MRFSNDIRSLEYAWHFVTSSCICCKGIFDRLYQLNGVAANRAEPQIVLATHRP